MKPVYLITLFWLCFLSCHHKPTPSNKQDTIISKQEQTKIAKIGVDKVSIIPDTTRKLLSYNTTHLFSDRLEKDNFDITLYGGNITEGVIVFKIYNNKNQQLFKDTFPAEDLLGDEAELLNIKQQKDTITTRMAKFLNDENFISPAIGSTEKFDEDFENPDPIDKINWNAVKADNTSVRFTYSHGYESTYGIAYSKIKRKVVNIFYGD